jgi:hypothetical protein
MIVTPNCAIKNIGSHICWTLHLFVRRHFSLATLSLYFLFDMSSNSLRLRTNSINFSSTVEDKNITRRKQTLEVLWKRWKTVHTAGIEQVHRGTDLSITSVILAQQQRRDGDVHTSVNSSVQLYMRKFTERHRSMTDSVNRPCCFLKRQEITKCYEWVFGA